MTGCIRATVNSARHRNGAGRGWDEEICQLGTAHRSARVRTVDFSFVPRISGS